jgi:hypothetical protein
VCTVTAAFGFGGRSTPPPPPPPPNGKKVCSKYYGVGFNKKKRKWTARVVHNRKPVNIGQAFDTEMEAVNAVDKWLKENGRAAEANLDESGNFVPRVSTKSSEFTGVCWDKKASKWSAYIWHGGRQENLGLFDDEEEAARAYDLRAAERGRPTNFDVHGQRCHAGATVVPPPQPPPATALYDLPSAEEMARCHGTSSVS